METTNFVNELFNINYENLQEFLEKTVNVINSHAKTISFLEDQLKSKLSLPQVFFYEKLISISFFLNIKARRIINEDLWIYKIPR